MAASTAAGHGPLRRRSVAVLATAALGLVTFAGPAQATSGPPVPLAQPVSATAAGLATDDNSGLTPTPDMPAPLIATAEPEAQAIAAKYQADAQAVTAQASAAKAEEGPLETRAADVQTREANLEAQFASTQARTNTLNGQADALNTAIATHNGEPHQFQLPAQASQLAAYNQEKANLEAQQANLQSQFNALTAQTTQLQSAQAQVDADQVKVNADIQKHNAAVAALQTQISNLKAERQASVAKIAALLQNMLPGTQTGGASPLATAGGDQSAPASVLAPTPQAQALPSGGGDQAAPAQVGTYAVATGATGTAGTQTGSGSAKTGTAPPLVVTQTTVATYLPPAAIAGMSADQAANVNPLQTYGALIPEPSGNYAVLQLPPPAGTTAPPGQQAYTNAINKGAKATTYIAGKPVVVDHVVSASPLPTANQGADTARPALASPLAATSPWASALAQPGAVAGPPVSVTALRGLLNQNGLGAEANQYDIEYAPVVLDANGNPTYATAPADAQGNPELGPTGKPILRFSNLGLQNPDLAENAFEAESLDHDLSQDRSLCPEHSFSGSTRVLIADGSTKAIADVRVGDLIRNARPNGGTEIHRVEQVHITTTDTDFVDVVVTTRTGAATITGTANHPFYDLSRAGFVEAGDLHAGDLLQTGSGGPATVDSVRAQVGPLVTYDLTIDGLHTYFVVAGDTPVLVHNTKSCWIGPPLAVDPAQFGKKWGKHAKDFNLNPGSPEARAGYTKSIADTWTDPDEVRQGPWNPANGGSDDYLFARRGNMIVLTKADGTFVTTLNSTLGNGWWDAASVVYPK